MSAFVDKLDRPDGGNPRLSEAVGILLLAFSLAVLLSLISYDPLDPAWNVATTRVKPLNWIGSFGAWLADALFQIFGLSAFIIPVLLTTIGWRTFRLRELSLLRRRFIGLTIMLVAVAGLLSLPSMPFYRMNVRFGGAVGYLLAYFLETLLNKTGSGIFLSVLLIFSIMLATEFSFNRLLEGAGTRSLMEMIVGLELSLRRQFTNLTAQLRHRFDERRAQRTRKREEAEREKKRQEEERLRAQEAARANAERQAQKQDRSATMAGKPATEPLENPPTAPIVGKSGRDLNELRKLVYGDDAQQPLPEFSVSSRIEADAVKREMPTLDEPLEKPRKSTPIVPPAAPPAPIEPPVLRRKVGTIKVPMPEAVKRSTPPPQTGDPEINSMLASAMIERTSDEPEKKAVPPAPPKLQFSDFRLPDLAYLTPPPPKQEQADDELWERARVLAEKCKEFSVSGKIQYISPGPVVTTFEFKPDPGVKYSRITSLEDDLCLALKAESIRIDRIPGKSTVGIEVPNVKREVIHLREIFESEKYQTSPSPLTLALGKTIDGKTHVADLTRMPHLLIAGATGTGKSVCLNSVIVSILYKSTPDDVKMIMVDPKRLELGLYEGIPHLLTPIVIDPKRASNALKWAVGEMENRYKMLAGHGVRNIDQYNQQVRQKLDQIPAMHPDEQPKPLPYIVIIIDELADLMMVASSDVETSITRLAQMARAVGIHLVIATQRPSVDVITGLIKANFPSRISFRVSSKVDSRTILDTNGAETLLGQGDMLFLPPGTSRLVRVHGAYIGEAEIGRIVDHIRAQAKPAYDESIQVSEEEAELNEEGMGIKDELYDEALRIICQMGRASTSVLQRRLRIGYGRAAAILDMMEREGYVGPSEGSKPRVVKQLAYDYLERLDQIKEE